MYVWPIVFFLLVVGWGQAALAQTLDSEFKTWRVFALAREKQKTCYVTSSPVKKTGTYKHRGAPYIIVTHRGKNPAEVGVSAGYPYKPKSSVDITIDTQPPHAFFTTTKTPQIAWARDTAEDKKIVQEMLKGVTMTVTAQARTKTSSTDTYDLQGFPPAYTRMQALCKAPTQ
jgi:invasion protein IalB